MKSLKENNYIGFRGNMLMSKIEDKALSIAINAVKTRFTIPIKINSNSVDYVKYIQLLRRIDRKFTKHTTESNGRKYIDGLFAINTGKGSYIFVYGYPEFTATADKNDSGYILYCLDMYLVGPGSLNILKKIKNYINSVDAKGSEEMITLYEISGEKDGWTSIKSFVERRGFDTLFFNGNIHNEIREHIDNWEKCAETFKERGLTHKTGILVYGKAGTGKSTLARALASELNYNLISIDTSTFDNINLIELTNAINNDNMKAIIFLDEIDTIFKSRDDEDTTDDQKARVTKLLSFLDGVNSPNNCIFLATTNYYNKLDAAVKRKGRFDKVIELTDINKEAAFKMCKSFGLSNESSKNIVDEYKKDLINPADLQDKIISVIRKELADD